MSEKTLRICHLYPDLLNLYGDRGNILCMRRRLEWRGIDAEVTEVTVGEQADFTQFDLFFIGGACRECCPSAAVRTLSRRCSCPT